MTQPAARTLLRALLRGGALLGVVLAVLAPLGFAWWVSGRVIGQEGRSPLEAEDRALAELDPGKVAGSRFERSSYGPRMISCSAGGGFPPQFTGAERVGVVSVRGRGGDRRAGLR